MEKDSRTGAVVFSAMIDMLRRGLWKCLRSNGLRLPSIKKATGFSAGPHRRERALKLPPQPI
jgi:hypothetical protein